MAVTCAVNRKPWRRASVGLISGGILFAAMLTSGRAARAEEVPPLAGPALERQQEWLARWRLLPRQVPSEVRAVGGLRGRLFKPSAPETAKKYPLVIYLHGGGPRRDFDHLLEGNAPGFAYGIGRFVASDTQAEHPCFVYAPWSGPQGWDEKNRRAVIAEIQSLIAGFPIDPDRIYLTGQSMGGHGTWALLMEHPEMFAAGVPVCGGGEPSKAARARAVPVWAFHGTADTLVPVQQSRRMVRAWQEAGGNARYSEYQAGTHAGTAERAYCEPDLVTWLFAQKKNAPQK